MNCCQKTSEAAEKGHLECLKTLYSQGVQWDFYTTLAAAEKGHLDCLKYAHENGCKWDYDTMYWAAFYGHLDCLKYAHENGCEWDEYTTSSATHYNHLDCLLYCLENGCPIHPETLNKLYKRPWGVLNEINKNLLTNLLLRKVLLHPKIKNDITEKYPEFLKAIKEYEEYINKVYKLVELKTTLPTDIIKYELLKYL